MMFKLLPYIPEFSGKSLLLITIGACVEIPVICVLRWRGGSPLLRAKKELSHLFWGHMWPGSPGKPKAHMVARESNFGTRQLPSAKQLLIEAPRGRSWLEKILQVDPIGLSSLKEVFLCLISWKPFCYRWIIQVSVLLVPYPLPSVFEPHRFFT